LVIAILSLVVARLCAFVFVPAAAVGAGFAAPLVAAPTIIALVIPIITGVTTPISLILGHLSFSCLETRRTQPPAAETPRCSRQFRQRKSRAFFCKNAQAILN